MCGAHDIGSVLFPVSSRYQYVLGTHYYVIVSSICRLSMFQWVLESNTLVAPVYSMQITQQVVITNADP